MGTPNPKEIFTVTIKAHYRVEEPLQELQDVFSRKNSHLGQTVLMGERQLLSEAEKKLNESRIRTETSKLVQVNGELLREQTLFEVAASNTGLT